MSASPSDIARLPLFRTLSPATVAGYTLAASLAGIPASVPSLGLLVRLSGPSLSPAVSALRLTWTPDTTRLARTEAAEATVVTVVAAVGQRRPPRLEPSVRVR